MTLLARRYATALHLAATQGNSEQQRGEQVAGQLLADLTAVHAALQLPGARAMLLSPDLGHEQRQQLLERLGQGRHPLLQNLLQLLLRRHRLEVLFDLQPAFRALVMQDRGQLDGVVETPLPLDEAQLADLQRLSEQLTRKQVALRVEVKPELIGGVRLRLGNVLYDGSVKSALDQLEQQLLSAPV